MLTTLFVGWVAACVLLGIVFIRGAPSIAVALDASVLGALLVIATSDAAGKAGVPFACAMGASAGLIVGGITGPLVVPRVGSAKHLRVVAVVVLATAPFLGAALTLALQRACPLYVNGPGSGACNFGDTDVLGGWITGVVFLFLADAVIVAVLLFMAALEVEHGDPDRALRDRLPAANVTRDPR